MVAVKVYCVKTPTKALRLRCVDGGGFRFRQMPMRKGEETASLLVEGEGSETSQGADNLLGRFYRHLLIVLVEVA